MKEDIAFKTIKYLYKNCRPYDSNYKLYNNYNGIGIIRYIEKIVKDIFCINGLKTRNKFFEKTINCAAVNVLEQLVFIQNLYDSGISVKDYINKLYLFAIDSRFQEGDSQSSHFNSTSFAKEFDEIIEIMKNKQRTGEEKIGIGEDLISSLRKSFLGKICQKTRCERARNAYYSHNAISPVYEQYLFKRKSRNTYTHLSNPYLNIITALFDIIDIRDMSDILALNIHKKISVENILKIYSYVRNNVFQCKKEHNISEFLIIERLFGISNMAEVMNSDKTDSEKDELLLILRELRYFGFTPLHQYIITQYTNRTNQNFYDKKTI